VRTRLWFIAFAIGFAVGPVARACTFCGDGLARRQPLVQHFGEARLVVYGRLKNPRPAADGLGGTTELHVETILKAEKGLDGTRLIVIPRYIPVIGDTPAEYLLFCTVTDGKLDPVHGVPAGRAAATYLAAAARLDRADPAKALGFFFRHLDAAEPAVSDDAFLEFARATDRDIQKAARALDRSKIRAWLVDPKTPEERLGVYGMTLGLCGTRDDAAWLGRELGRDPLPDRYAAALGGLTAGLTLLDPPAGWAVIETVLTARTRSFTEKLSVIGTLRYLHATRWAESKDRVLKCYATLIRSGDFADLATEDLRRWACWDLTPTILDQFDRPTHRAPAVRRGTVRYALACPDAAAREFVASVRGRDPELVRKVEESNKLYEAPPVQPGKR